MPRKLTFKAKMAYFENPWLLGKEAKRVAASRRTEVAALAKCLHRELEWIPLKSMRKDRAERYRSASEMADDIDNYLNGAPLIAGPPSAGYRPRSRRLVVLRSARGDPMTEEPRGRHGVLPDILPGERDFLF